MINLNNNKNIVHIDSKIMIVINSLLENFWYVIYFCKFDSHLWFNSLIQGLLAMNIIIY